jgi:CBS domain-containing protein
MKIKDVMTKDVIALGPSDTLEDAIELFSRNRISGAPVVDAQRRVIGILTEMDILKRLEIGSIETTSPPRGTRRAPASHLDGAIRIKRLSDALRGIGELKVSKVMTSPAVTVGPEDRVEEKATLMVHRRIRRLPVVDHDGVLAGIVSRKDLIRALSASGQKGGGK